MIITFNTDSLREYGLSIESYVALLLIANNKQDLLDSYLVDTYGNIHLEVSKDIRNILLRNEFLEPVNEWKVTDKAKHLIFGDNLWLEFLAEFPQKVTRTDGTVDFLRTDLTNAENIYLSYVGHSRDKHNHILKCLRAEIRSREENGSMPYMKRIFSWISSKNWTSYEDITDQVLNTNKDLGYGTTLI